jgi:CDP-6-deoxy-D-xylo-4-hexulose-3-dehydrase
VRIVIIGASGLVGSAALQAFEHAGHEVTGTYLRHPDEGLRPLDLADEQAVHRLIAEVQPEAVLLPAALTDVEYCESHAAEAHLANVVQVEHVLRACEQWHPLVVYYSTDYIFDGQHGPYSEESEPHPQSVYGHTKLAAECLVQSYARHLILRTTVVYGWRRSSMNFAVQMISKLNAGEQMWVPDDQVGNPTLAEHLGEVTVRLVQDDVRGVVNVAGRERLSRFAFAQELARTLNLDDGLLVPVPTASLNQQARRPLEGGFVLDRLQTLLGTEPLPLSQALAHFRRQWRADTIQRAAHSRVIPDEGQHLRQEISALVRRYYRAVHAPAPFTPYKTKVPFSGRVFGEEEMVNLVDSALDFWLTLGPYGDEFERRMSGVTGARDFVLVNSGSSANLVAIAALLSPQLERPLRSGDEVITPAVTFPTTLAPIVQNGLVPVFVDCAEATYNIDPGLVEEALTERTRAIFVPHTLGNPCDMTVLCDLAQTYNLYLIEDCCDALGGTYANRPVGAFGDLATVSFYPAHHMTMGEGGGVFVNKARFGRIVRSLRDWGRDCWCAPGEANTCGKRFGWQLGDLPLGYDHKYTYSHIGYNLKPTDMQAAVGLAQLDRLPEFVEVRRRNFQRLYDGLHDLEAYVILPRWLPRAKPSWFGFPLTLREGLSRRALIEWLEQASIETRLIFGGNITKQPGFRNIKYRVAGRLKNSDVVMQRSFFVGVYPGLSDEMIDFMIQRLRRGLTEIAV